MDIIRGISTILLGILVIFNIKNLFFIISNSIILSISTCFYQTSINSSLSEIFIDNYFVESNSFINSIINISEIIASSVSGILSAPVLFILNGASFIISVINELFLKFHSIEKKEKKKLHVFKEIKISIISIKQNSKLKQLLFLRCITGALISLNGILVITLFYKFFSKELFGIANSFKIIGGLIGFLLLIFLFISIGNLIGGFLAEIFNLRIIILINSFIILGTSVFYYYTYKESKIIAVQTKEGKPV